MFSVYGESLPCLRMQYCTHALRLGIYSAESGGGEEKGARPMSRIGPLPPLASPRQTIVHCTMYNVACCTFVVVEAIIAMRIIS